MRRYSMLLLIILLVLFMIAPAGFAFYYLLTSNNDSIGSIDFPGLAFGALMSSLFFYLVLHIIVPVFLNFLNLQPEEEEQSRAHKFFSYLEKFPKRFILFIFLILFPVFIIITWLH